ncbi:hypothetical protein [Pseudoalteromonas rubra]|uniref:Uncharacterized protein n=1 Tax=Pseudoalteromonas rubra TaxID=43658 RepID=A0A0U3HTU2_9GAMM|nr:hypothetical protein [Pseudoalteromonas rubra]ALU44889.1 hypothetical protein AT705_19190 [Pseudoalteromonas rubra]
MQTKKGWNYWNEVKNNPEQNANVADKAILLISLCTQRYFFERAKQSDMLNIGRLFEIIIASLVYTPKLEDLERVIRQAPFHSASALAPANTLIVDEEDNESNEESNDGELRQPDRSINVLLPQLTLEIEKWRNEYKVDQLNLSPWLVYQVFNKVFNQGIRDKVYVNDSTNANLAVQAIAKSFYLIWSAFGSFEKGRLFGLPEVVATNNLKSAKNFESNDHFNLNIRPFSPTKSSRTVAERERFGELSRTVTYVLSRHPLRAWIEDVVEEEEEWFQGSEIQTSKPKSETKKTTGATVKERDRFKERVSEMFGLDSPPKQLSKTFIKKMMQAQEWDRDKFQASLLVLEKEFKDKYTNTFKDAGFECFPEQGSD